MIFYAIRPNLLYLSDIHENFLGFFPYSKKTQLPKIVNLKNKISSNKQLRAQTEQQHEG